MRYLPWILRALLLLMVLRFVLRLLFPPRRPVGPAPRGARPQERLGGELVRDPQCGTAVPKAKALAVGSGDATLYFCSAACHDAYAAAHAALAMTTDALDRLRADIVEVGRRLWVRGFVASNDGNISVRIAPDRLLVTPSNVSKGFMSPDMMVVTDLDGRLISGAPGRKPSSEILMHLVAYRQRPDVGAVVHAHPALATGFAVAGFPLDRAILAEVITTLGAIPIADYGTPSTTELADSVAPYVKAHDGLLLANHGALALGQDLFAAYYKMETIEHFAKISLVARLLGREHLISREEVDRLQALRGQCGIAAPAPICPDPAPADASAGDPSCQVVVAPHAPGERLVADTSIASGAGRISVGADGEIRLTYAQLTELIDEAVRQLAAAGAAHG